MTKRGSAGFTLIEIMIVVVILGVLAAIAYPSYQKYAMESRRSDALIAITQLNNDLEKFYSECGIYTTAITGASRSCTTPAGGSLGRTNANSPNQFYTLTVAIPPTAGVPVNGFLITATAAGKQLADKDCRTFTLTNAGTQGATAASGGNTARCWRR